MSFGKDYSLISVVTLLILPLQIKFTPSFGLNTSMEMLSGVSLSKLVPGSTHSHAEACRISTCSAQGWIMRMFPALFIVEGNARWIAHAQLGLHARDK